MNLSAVIQGNKLFLTLFLVFFLLLTIDGNAQLLKKLGDKAKQASDKILNSEKKPATSTEHQTPATASNPVASNPVREKNSDIDLYGTYDFVPGDSILFNDELEEEEANEIPSRWLLDQGRAEILQQNDSYLISARGGTSLRPRMKEPTYLPKRFTIEFDVKYINYSWQYGRSLSLSLANPSKDKNQDAGEYANKRIQIYASAEANFGTASGEWPQSKRDDAVNEVLKDWKHIAIAVNEKSVKVYINQNRILNAQVEFGSPSSLILSIDNDYDAPVLIKNFKILSGGKNPAKQITTENVFIARGIQFEKASPKLLPESMGEINRIVALMQQNKDLKFEIGGHTSAEAGGNAEANQKLSEERAAAVKAQMVKSGIAESRLTVKGYGQVKPIGDNTSPEGRASNRRVEFVKQ